MLLPGAINFARAIKALACAINALACAIKTVVGVIKVATEIYLILL